VLRYFAQLLQLAQRAQHDQQAAAATLADLATGLRDECCRVLAIPVTGAGDAGDGGGAGGRGAVTGGTEVEGALEGLAAAMGLLPVRCYWGGGGLGFGVWVWGLWVWGCWFWDLGCGLWVWSMYQTLPSAVVCRLSKPRSL